MTKTELIEKVGKDAGVSKADVNRVLTSLLDTVIKAVKKGDRITLTGFGTFYQSKRKARKGRNPRTGEAVKIAAAKTPKFSAGKAFKVAVNGK